MPTHTQLVRGARPDRTLGKGYYMDSRNFELNKEDANKRRSALNTLLADFDVPARRISELTPANLHWLKRNIAINNGSNPMLFVVQDLLSWLVRWENKKSREVSQ